MARMLVELSNDTHRDFKIMCLKRGVTMRDQISELVIKELDNEKESA
jgi:hypothetical protein